MQGIRMQSSNMYNKATNKLINTKACKSINQTVHCTRYKIDINQIVYCTVKSALYLSKQYLKLFKYVNLLYSWRCALYKISNLCVFAHVSLRFVKEKWMIYLKLNVKANLHGFLLNWYWYKKFVLEEKAVCFSLVARAHH